MKSLFLIYIFFETSGTGRALARKLKGMGREEIQHSWGVKWEGNTIMWESPGYRANLPVSHMVHQISCVKGMNKLLKTMLHSRLTLYPQIYPNQTNIGFSN